MKTVIRCFRCKSFNVPDDFCGVFKIPIYRSMQVVGIEPTGEWKDLSSSYAQEPVEVQFPLPLCYDCETKFRFWIMGEDKR